MVRPVQSWKTFETGRDSGHRLAEVVRTATGAEVKERPVIRCDARRLEQEIIGFGGAMTESAAWTLGQLPANRAHSVLKAFFDPYDGIGYTFVRTHVNSCDFSLDRWTLDDVGGDVSLEHFSLDPMRRWVLPRLHDINRITGGQVKLLLSPWSPPAWMKDNHSAVRGGKLLPEHRLTWARFLAKTIDALHAEERLAVWGLTVQNEPAAVQPWESCIYSAEEERDFIRDFLGPTLKQGSGRDVRILAWDHNRDALVQRMEVIYADPAAAAHVWGAGLHWYVSEDFEATSRLRALYPDKPILFTEGCWEGGPKPGAWDRGERYARNLIGDLRNGVCGWIDWNMVLDRQGGPNHVSNFCDAPVLVDTQAKEVLFQNSFYYLGHFSRFVRPGSNRIPSEGGPKGIEHVAFLTRRSEIVLVVHNPTEDAVEFGVEVGAHRQEFVIPAHALQTHVAEMTALHLDFV
jgi:glucosylceramidase